MDYISAKKISKNIFEKKFKFFRKIFSDNIFQKNCEIQTHKFNFTEQFLENKILRKIFFVNKIFKQKFPKKQFFGKKFCEK